MTNKVNIGMMRPLLVTPEVTEYWEYVDSRKTLRKFSQKELDEIIVRENVRV